MMHDLRKRIRLTFLKRDMTVDDNVREFGDVVEGLRKSYFFLFNNPLNLETAQSKVGSSGWKSIACRVVFDAS